MNEFRSLDILKRILLEDIGRGDITTSSLENKDKEVIGKIICEGKGVAAGINLVLLLLKDMGITVEGVGAKDGSRVAPEEITLRIKGRACKILGLERTVLNLISHLSGIATKTALWEDMVKKAGFSATIAATRKTTPGIGEWEKYAVKIGGGDTHRLGLDDMAMLKDNHILLAGSIRAAVNQVKKGVGFSKKIEVEADTPEMAHEALEAGADIIMLDNFPPDKFKETAERLKKIRSDVLLEASGEITEDTLLDYAPYADIISSSRLTMDAPPLPFRMDLTLM